MVKSILFIYLYVFCSMYPLMQLSIEYRQERTCYESKDTARGKHILLQYILRYCYPVKWR